MTISTRIALGISATVLSLGLSLVRAIFTHDAAKKGGGLKEDRMPKDAMKKDDGVE
jgi:pentapeptide MXKDX repeat protein